MIGDLESRAAVLYGPKDIRIEKRKLNPLKDDEVLMKVLAVGICGSDLHFYAHGGIGGTVPDGPLKMGHETTGKILMVGSEVTKLAVGDHVVLEPGVPCRKCEFCSGGRYNLCKRIVFHGGMHPIQTDGTLGDYLIHKADFCHKFDPNVFSPEAATMFEPMSVGLFAVQKAGSLSGKNVLIIGCGTLGLLTCLTVQACGGDTIWMADINDMKLGIAKEFGAKHTVNVKGKSRDELFEIFKPFQPDVVLECTGVASAVYMAMDVAVKNARVLLVGLSPDHLQAIPFRKILDNELVVRGVFRYVNCFPLAIKLATKEKFPLERLITHKYDLNDKTGVQEAFDTLLTDSSAIKVVVKC